MSLTHLFNVEWKADPAAASFISAEGREGAFIGAGAGVVTGSVVQGTIRFSFFTGDCPYDPGFVERTGLSLDNLGDHICTINPGGVIETSDGAQIQFDVKGFGLRRSDRVPMWTLTGSVRLVTDDERYRWLNGVIGVWEGDFDEERRSSRFRTAADTALVAGTPAAAREQAA